MADNNDVYPGRVLAVAERYRKREVSPVFDEHTMRDIERKGYERKGLKDDSPYRVLKSQPALHAWQTGR